MLSPPKYGLMPSLLYHIYKTYASFFFDPLLLLLPVALNTLSLLASSFISSST